MTSNGNVAVGITLEIIEYFYLKELKYLRSTIGFLEASVNCSMTESNIGNVLLKGI
jgi:hypothetical protein